MHLGGADPCDFPKCGKLDCIICGSGGLRSRSPLTLLCLKDSLVHVAALHTLTHSHDQLLLSHLSTSHLNPIPLPPTHTPLTSPPACIPPHALLAYTLHCPPPAPHHTPLPAPTPSSHNSCPASPRTALHCTAHSHAPTTATHKHSTHTPLGYTLSKLEKSLLQPRTHHYTQTLHPTLQSTDKHLASCNSTINKQTKTLQR